MQHRRGATTGDRFLHALNYCNLLSRHEAQQSAIYIGWLPHGIKGGLCGSGFEAVANYGWLKPGEMFDSMALAETTPGQLIQVVQFVGFSGAFRLPGMFNPYVAGTLGALLTVWVTLHLVFSGFSRRALCRETAA